MKIKYVLYVLVVLVLAACGGAANAPQAAANEGPEMTVYTSPS